MQKTDSINTRSITVEMPMRSLETRLVKDTVDAEKRTAQMVFSSEKPVRTYRWKGWDIEEFNEILSMDPAHMRRSRLDKGAVPLLNSHRRFDLSDQLGTVLDATFTEKQLIGDVKFSRRQSVQEIFDDVVDGVIGNGSVGYRVYKYQDESKDDDKIKTLRAVDWELIEMSLVPVGADENAGTQNGKRSEGREAELFECEIILNEKQTQCGNRADQNLKGEEMSKVTTTAVPDSKETAAADLEKARKEGAEAEKQRTAEIREAVRAAGLDQKFEDEMIAGAQPADEVRKLVLKKLAEKDVAAGDTRSHSPVDVVTDETDKFREGATNWLVLRSGSAAVQLVEKQSGKRLDAGEFRGLSLVDLARMSLERAGVKTRGMDRMTLVGTAFTYRSGMNTTGDFPVMLENLLHKVLLGAYGVTPDTWSRFCKRGSVSDFRPHPRYRLGSFGRLDSLNEHGEFKNKSIPDAEKGSITAGTKGNIIGLTRQAIINDDMGGFIDLGTRLGRAGKLSIEMDVYDLLALNSGLGPNQGDGQPLFHANRANVNGTGSALSAAGLDADRVVLGAQKDPSGNEILDLRPAILLVPLGLGGQAKVINESQYDPDNVASGSKAVMRPNVSRGIVRDIVDTARLTGTRRYMFADPALAPVIEVAFLDGQENPYLEIQNGWRLDGAEWKVRLDYGVGAIDSRGAVTNAGA